MVTTPCLMCAWYNDMEGAAEPAVERLRGESILDDILTHLKCRGVPPILEERARAVLGFYQQSVVQLRCSSIDTDRR